MRLHVLLLAVVLLLAGPLANADEGPITRIPLPHPVLPEHDWYGVYQGREKVGWACLELELQGEEAAARYVSRSRVEATLTGFGQRLEFALDATDVFRGVAPFELLTSRETRRDGDVVRTIHLDRLPDGRYRVEQTEGEDARTLVLDDLAYTLADRLTVVHWGMRHPCAEEQIHVREFEITDVRHDVYGYRVEAVRQRPARGIRIEVRDVRLHSHLRGDLGVQVIDDDGRMLRGSLAGVAELRLEAQAQAQEQRFASELFAFGRAPTTEPIGDPRTIRRLEVAVYGRGHDRLRSGPRQSVRPTGDGGTLLLLGADAGPGEAPTAVEIAEASKATATYPADREDVRALARQAVGDAAAPEVQVSRLLAFVADRVVDLALPSEYPVERLLVEPKGDATEHARLFVTLARSLGIPAREVRGLVYLGDEEQAFGGHAWAEVALDGRWQGVDPTWDLGAPTASHVAFERGSETWTAMLAVTRNLTFEIRGAEPGR